MNSRINARVKREDLAEDLFHYIIDNQNVLLYGPAYWGKSFLAREDLISVAAKKYNTECLYLDFYALRLSDPSTLDRETTRWLFQGNEKSFQKFYLKCQKKNKNLFHAFLDKEYLAGHLNFIIIDHTEKLASSPEVTAWLKRLSDYLTDRDICILWIQRTNEVTQSRLFKLMSNIRPYQMPLLTNSEIEFWVEQMEFKKQTVEEVISLTGGLVSLTRDIGLWLERRNSLKFFEKSQVEKYSASTALALEIFCESPEEYSDWKDFSSKISNQLLITGGFVNKDDKIKFVSSYHEKRMKKVITAKNMLLAGATKAWRNRYIPLEVQTLSFKRHLFDENSLSSSLLDMREFFFVNAKASVRYFLPDYGHPLIWKEVEPKDRYGAIQQGTEFLVTNEYIYRPFRRVLRGIRRFPSIPKERKGCIFAVVGKRGQVDMIIEASQTSKVGSAPWVNMLWARGIAHVIQTLEQAISQKVTEYQLAQRKKSAALVRLKLDKKPVNKETQIYENLLIESDASLLAVLKYTSSITDDYPLWGASVFISREDIFTTDMLRDQNKKWLKKISQETSRALILSDNSILKYFPHLEVKGRVSTVYIKVMEVGNGERKIVIFVYYDDEKVILNTQKQLHLFYLSQRLVYIDLLKNYWKTGREKELKVLNKIGQAMSDTIANPSKAVKMILETLQEFFGVSSISINQVIKCYNNDYSEVQMIAGVGYELSYKENNYPVCKDLKEGKTGFIARTKSTLVSWNNDKEIYLANTNDGMIQPLSSEIKINGLGKCASSLSDKEVNSFLGTPIMLIDDESGTQEVIGVLKMANKHSDKNQRFLESDIASAQRITNLLAPFLYLLRQRSRFGLYGRLDSMAALIRGIGHEVTTPLKTIRWRNELLSLDNSLNEKTKNGLLEIKNAEIKIRERLYVIRALALNNPGRPDFIDLTSFLNAEYNNDPIVNFEEIDKGITIQMDSSYFRTVLENLIDNAKNALEGITDKQIRIYTERHNLNDEVTLVISDNGPGVDETITDNLFDPFVSTNKIQTNKPEIMRGIGLALVRTIVEVSNGKIDYRRKNNETEFFMILPGASNINGGINV